jgi:hypothetical protein
MQSLSVQRSLKSEMAVRLREANFSNPEHSSCRYALEFTLCEAFQQQVVTIPTNEPCVGFGLFGCLHTVQHNLPKPSSRHPAPYVLLNLRGAVVLDGVNSRLITGTQTSWHVFQELECAPRRERRVCCITAKPCSKRQHGYVWASVRRIILPFPQRGVPTSQTNANTIPHDRFLNSS